MLTVSGVEKHFGARTVLSGVSFALRAHNRAALVGRNGSGKTTLMKILCGRMAPDAGRVSLLSGMRLGYLEQEGHVDPNLTLYEEMRSTFAGVDALEAEVRELERRMGEPEASADGTLDDLMSRYSRLQDRLLHAQPEMIDARIGTILRGLGFVDADFAKLCGHFSGGWQMRAALARLLLDLPDVLLLDEPTNHLDVEATEWLEQFLLDFGGSTLLVSHDRAFLDKVCNRTLELSDGTMEDYAGNYSYYEAESARRFELQLAAYRSQQKKLEQDMKFVERFRYKASLASRVQSRLKLIGKRDLVDLPQGEERSIQLTFVPSLDSGREVLLAKGLNKAYSGRPVLTNVACKIERGQRIALVGPNGAGKSTLLRLLCGQEAPDSGKVTTGYRLGLVYFAQHQAEALMLERTVIEEVAASAPAGTTPGQLRNLLGGLLFTGDQVFKKIEVLSGGERSRVALARCLATPSNFLALDEPTNHLDIDARENLLDALEQYPGTLLVISHDRYFLERIAQQVWEVGPSGLRCFDGGYAEYRRVKAAERQEADRQAEAAAQAKLKQQKAQSAQFRDIAKQARSAPVKHHWTLDALEKKIFALEGDMEKLSVQLGDPETYKDAGQAQKLQARFDTLQTECQHLTSIWEEMVS